MRRVLVLDNSVAVTGALLSALATADACRSDAIFEFVLPQGSQAQARVAADGFQVHALPMVELGRSWRRLMAYVPMLLINALRLRRLLRERRANVLLANDYYNLLPALVRCLGWRGRTVTLIRLLPDSQPRILSALWLRAARRCSDRIVAVSRAVAAQADPAVQAEVVYFPVEARYLCAPQDPPPRQPNGEVRLLYLANYIRGKGQERALQAFARMAADVPGARLVFAGGDMGLEKNRAFRAELEQTAVTLGVAGRVQFLGAQPDPLPLYQQADIVLNFSSAESFSHTCAEAGLLGRPVIATRCGGPEELVEDGRTGLLVAIGDVPAMAAAMRRLCLDTDLRLRMGQAAQARLRALLDPAHFVSRLRPVLFGRDHGH